MTPPSTVARVRTLLVLAWPIVIARSTQAVVGFCDAYMTAPLGEAALAATTTGSINFFAMVILPMGIAFIVQSFASQLHGRGDALAARRYAWYGLALAAASALVGAGLAPWMDAIVGLLELERSVAVLMASYLAIRLFAVGAVVGTEVLGNWYAGLGNTVLHMIAGLVTMVANVALNWVLIYGHLVAPALGIDGAALASVVASWIGFGVLALCFWRCWSCERPREALSLRRREFIRMLRFGLPNGINWFLEFAAFIVFINVVVVELGTTVLAALMVVFNVNSVSFMPAFGLCSAGAVLTGQAIGAGRPDEAAPIVYTTALVTAGWQGLVGLVYLAAPATIMGWFATGNGAGLVEVGAVMLAMSAAWQLFDALAMTLSEALRAAGDTTWPMYARLFVGWALFTPGAFIAVIVMGGGHVAAVLCLVAYLALLAALLVWRFRTGAWRRIDLIGTG